MKIYTHTAFKLLHNISDVAEDDRVVKRTQFYPIIRRFETYKMKINDLTTYSAS